MPALGHVNAGVLAALFEEDGEARLILTRRSSGLRTHKGEVSFPGGRLNEGEDPAAAARREAHEEVDLDPALVTMVGWLHPVMTLVSPSLIMPVIAVVPGRPHLVASPREVERVFDVALAELADPAIFHEERWQRSRAHHPRQRRRLVSRAVLRGLGRDDLGRHRPHDLGAHHHRRDRGRPASDRRL